MPRLHYEQVVPMKSEEAFRFFEDPYNLLKITPPRLNLSVTNPERIVMRPGAEITYTIRWLGVPLKWLTLISVYEPPRKFVDIQVRGPYRKWQHTHLFVPEGDETLIVDDVEYEMPFGLLGTLVDRSFVHRQLEGIFAYRKQRIQELLSKAAGAKDT